MPPVFGKAKTIDFSNPVNKNNERGYILAKILRRFSTQDIILIAIIAALGLAVKPIISPIIHLVSAPLLIPGGALAGGFYMLWFGVVIVFVPHTGSAIILALVQGVVTIIMGHFGNHGIMSIVIYLLPGVTAELTAKLFRNKKQLFSQAAICSAANLTGVTLVALLIMRLPLIPFMVSLITALFSGIVGGSISYMVISKLSFYNFEDTLKQSANSKRRSGK